MEYNFTPLMIKNIEKDTGKPLFALVSEMSMETIFIFFRYIYASKNDVEISEMISEALSDGKDTMDIQLEIIQGLEDRGFLPKKLKISQQIREKMTEMEQSISTSNGN